MPADRVIVIMIATNYDLRTARHPALVLSTSLAPLVASALLIAVAPASAQGTDVQAMPLQASVSSSDANERYHWELSVSPYTLHWKHDPDHRRVGLIGIERHDTADNSLWGFSVFPNSFGQPSAYAYYGHQWNGIAGHDPLYFKLSGGIIYGYKGEYADKVPFNHKGFAPVLIPAVGYRFTPRDAVQAAVLGTAGEMFSYNRKF